MSRKIIIIDDSLMLLRFASNILGKLAGDFEVYTAKRASEGLKQVQSEKPDLILLDYILPDISGAEICKRLHDAPDLAKVPVVLMCTNGSDTTSLKREHPNVVRFLKKPFTPDLLVSTVESVLAGESVDDFPSEKPETPFFPDTPAISPDSSPETPIQSLPQKPRRIPLRGGAPKVRADIRSPEAVELASPTIAFAGQLGRFNLSNVLESIVDEKLTGVLKIFLQRYPLETFVANGRLILITSRDVGLYLQDSPVILSSQHAELIRRARQRQTDTGCPLFLTLAAEGILSPEDAIEMAQEHGERMFATLWTRRRLHFEFECTKSLPEFARSFPKSSSAIHPWMLSNLRRVPQDEILQLDEFSYSGVPSFTRKGYEKIQHLDLLESEIQFASSVNGATRFTAIADKTGLDEASIVMIFYRFYSMGMMEYWPESAVESDS